MKTKMMEAKYHEEKLKLQQKHDADVQKVEYVQFIILLMFSILNIYVVSHMGSPILYDKFKLNIKLNLNKSTYALLIIFLINGIC